MPLIPVRDIEIWYERAGAGPPLLAISGSRGDLRRKPNLFDSPLRENFDLLAYDQRGLGRTSKPDQPYPRADFADDAAALLDAIGWDRVAVLGVSFGGMVALELALRHPDRVARLALCCTSPDTLQHLAPEERGRLMVPLSDTRNDAAWAARNPEALAERTRAQSDDPYADEPNHAIGSRRLMEARASHDTWDRLDRIACPVLIAGGRYDGIALPETQERMAARIKGAELRMFQGGHLFLWQDGSAFPAVAEFLAGEAPVPSSSGSTGGSLSVAPQRQILAMSLLDSQRHVSNNRVLRPRCARRRMTELGAGRRW
jgi:3-oxoadipate enol-lactonase